MTGQNAPTQASKVPKSTSRTIGSSINATSESAHAEIVKIVTSVGLIKSLTSDPTITESISAEKIRPWGIFESSVDSDGVHINTKAYIEPSNSAWMTPSDEIAQLLKFQIRAKRTSLGTDEETNCHSSSAMKSKLSVTSVFQMSVSVIASFSRSIKIEKLFKYETSLDKTILVPSRRFSKTVTSDFPWFSSNKNNEQTVTNINTTAAILNTVSTLYQIQNLIILITFPLYLVLDPNLR